MSAQRQYGNLEWGVQAAGSHFFRMCHLLAGGSWLIQSALPASESVSQVDQMGMSVDVLQRQLGIRRGYWMNE